MTTSGKESVEIKTKSGLAIVLDEGKRVVEIATEGGAKITLDDKGKSVKMIAGGSSIKVEERGITISCQGKLVIDAVDVEIKAKAKMNLEGNAVANVKSSGVLTIRGGLVKIN